MSNFEAHSNCAGTISSSWCQVTAGVFQRTNKCATGRSCPHKEALFYKCKAYKGILALSRHAPEQGGDGLLRVQHAQRGSVPQRMELAVLQATLAPYFEPAAGGHMIDQAWQPRLTEGMVRAYLVEDRVAGFGHQAVNALHPDAPTPGPRLYHGPDLAGFQSLRQQLEASWVALLCERVGLPRERLPLLWDCDFMLGEPAADGAERFVLCEINVSSVSPFPPSAIMPLVEAVRRRVGPAPSGGR